MNWTQGQGILDQHERVMRKGGGRGHPTTNAKRMQRLDSWAFDEKQLQRILLAAFPNLKMSATQRAGSARWARVIYLYVRAGWPASDVANELNISVDAVRSIIRRARLTVRGLNPSGAPRTGRTGRPRKPVYRTDNTDVSN